MKIRFFDKSIIDAAVAVAVVATIVSVIYLLMPVSQFAHV